MDKKLLLLIGLGGLAVLSLVYGVVTPSKARRGASETSTPVSSTSKIRMPLEREIKRSSHPSWGRNPFSQPGAEVLKRPTLSGIAWDEKSPSAIINDQIVGVGDQIGGSTVVAIRPNSVVLNDGEHDFELSVSRQKTGSPPR